MSNFKPRMARCKKCGEPFPKNAAARVYCDECQEVRREERADEQKRRAKLNYIRKRDGLLPEDKLPEVPEPPGGFRPHVCLVSYQCRYGTAFSAGCNYYTATGELRTETGLFPIERGRCGLFKPRKREARPGWIKEQDVKREKGIIK